MDNQIRFYCLYMCQFQQARIHVSISITSDGLPSILHNDGSFMMKPDISDNSQQLSFKYFIVMLKKMSGGLVT